MVVLHQQENVSPIAKLEKSQKDNQLNFHGILFSDPPLQPEAVGQEGLPEEVANDISHHIIELLLFGLFNQSAQFIGK
jgi:hypothetical protein